MAEAHIPRDEWLHEMKRLSPSSEAFEAYVGLERFVVERTALTSTYRRNLGGDAKFATFNGSAMGHCSVIQIYRGQCELIWKWKKAVPGMSAEQHQAINASLGRFCTSLDGTKSKSWEQIKVLRLGPDRVKEAIAIVSNELLEILRPLPGS